MQFQGAGGCFISDCTKHKISEFLFLQILLGLSIKMSVKDEVQIL